MKNTRFRGPLFTAVLFVFCMNTPSGMARPYRAKFVYVVMNCGSTAPGTIRVVPEDADVFPFDVKPQETTNSWRGKAPIPFNADGLVASLRIDRGRTGCAKATHEPGKEPDDGDWVAEYRFTCDFAPAWRSLTIDNDANLPVSTVRSMSGFMPGDVPCKEESLKRMAPRALDDVAWKQEAIYVHFGDPGKLPYEYFAMLIANGKLGRIPITGEVPVKRQAVLQQLDVRGGRGTGNAGTIRDKFNLDKNIKVVKLKKVE